MFKVGDKVIVIGHPFVPDGFKTVIHSIDNTMGVNCSSIEWELGWTDISGKSLYIVSDHFLRLIEKNNITTSSRKRKVA